MSIASNQRGQRYFVHHLSERSYRPSLDVKYAVQILDSRGRAKIVGYIGDDEESFEVDGYEIPPVVLEAARRQPYGKGDYVNERGESIPPF